MQHFNAGRFQISGINERTVSQMKCRRLTEKERAYADRKSGMISDFLNTHHYDSEEDYGDAAVGFIRAVKFCFRFSSFTDEQFSAVAELYMENALSEKAPSLEIVNLDEVQDSCYIEEISDQTIGIAVEQFMTKKLTEYLLSAAAPRERRIMELLSAGVPEHQIIHRQGLTQADYENILDGIRSKAAQMISAA